MLSKTPKLRAPVYDTVIAALYFVYAALTVVPDFELEPDGVHLNDMFADREKQPFVLVESLCENKFDTLYLL